MATLLTVSEVAEILNVDVRTVWRWVSAGRLATKRLGPQVTRFRRSDVEAFIERGWPGR